MPRLSNQRFEPFWPLNWDKTKTFGFCVQKKSCLIRQRPDFQRTEGSLVLRNLNKISGILEIVFDDFYEIRKPRFLFEPGYPKGNQLSKLAQYQVVPRWHLGRIFFVSRRKQATWQKLQAYASTTFLVKIA